MEGINVRWFDYGLEGAVIGTLFIITCFVVKWALGFADRLSSEHRVEREEWRVEQSNVRDAHRSEREEWRKDFHGIADRHEEKLEKIVNTISDSLVDIARRDLGK